MLRFPRRACLSWASISTPPLLRNLLRRAEAPRDLDRSRSHLVDVGEQERLRRLEGAGAGDADALDRNRHPAVVRDLHLAPGNLRLRVRQVVTDGLLERRCEGAADELRY